jgi:hypothetical protein
VDFGKFPLNDQTAVSPGDFADYRVQNRSFEQLAAMGDPGCSVVFYLLPLQTFRTSESKPNFVDVITDYSIGQL